MGPRRSSGHFDLPTDMREHEAGISREDGDVARALAVGADFICGP